MFEEDHQPADHEDDPGEEYAIRPCWCFGEGCAACGNTGVIYP